MSIRVRFFTWLKGMSMKTHRVSVMCMCMCLHVLQMTKRNLFLIFENGKKKKKLLRDGILTLPWFFFLLYLSAKGSLDCSPTRKEDPFLHSYGYVETIDVRLVSFIRSFTLISRWFAIMRNIEADR